MDTPGGLVASTRAARGRDFIPIPETRVEVEVLQERLKDDARSLTGADATEALTRNARLAATTVSLMRK